MKLAKINLFYSVMIICLFAGSAFAQSDDDYYDFEIQYSDELKAGMEFTWEISKYNIEIPQEKLGLDQVSNSTVTTITADTSYLTTVEPEVTSTAVYTSYETSTDETTTEYYTEEETSFPEFPDIKAGTTITVKLLKDLANITEYDYADNYDYEVYLDGFFEMSYSAGTEEEMKNFIPAEALISPNTIVFENGTVMNFFEFQFLQSQKFQEEFNDDEYNSSFEIIDGVAIQTQSYNNPARNHTSSLNLQYDIDTGLLIYVYSELRNRDTYFEIELKLMSSKGINVKNLVANEDPTLSVPISAIFVYTLILVPILVNRIRKNH